MHSSFAPGTLTLHASILLATATGAWAQTTVVQFPAPVHFYQNSAFATDGPIGYVPSFDDDKLWSFSLDTGALLDADGLALPAPGTASDAFLFPGDLVAIPGWFPGQGIFVANVADPTNLALHGIISFPSTTNIQGQNVVLDAAGQVGFVAGFPDDRLYSFNPTTLTLEHAGGLPLPGNPDRIAIAGERVALVDTTAGRIMVADVSDPSNMTVAGVVFLPGNPTFGSDDVIVFAGDGRTGFVSSNQRVLYSFDVVSLALLDPNGVNFGSQGLGSDLEIHGTTLACVSSNGLSFVDASDPTSLSVIADAQFGGTVAMQGNATACFSADGSRAAVPIIFPANQIRAFDVATGAPVASPVTVDPQPNVIASLGATNRIAALCPGYGVETLWLIDGPLGPPEITTYCSAKLNSCGFLPAMGYSGIPSVVATQGFNLTASGARAGALGILIYGSGGPGNLPFQGGTLCIAMQGIARGPIVVSTGGTPGPFCDATFQVDMNAFATGNAGGNPQPFLALVGQVVHCQWWGRDTVAHGSFLSDGLQYLVSP